MREVGRSTRLSYAEAGGFEPPTSPLCRSNQTELRQIIPACGLHPTAGFEPATSHRWRKYTALLGFSILLSACAGKEELLPPAADMCALYSSYRYNAAAAAVEATDALDRHNSNERVFMERCLLGDRSRSMGPR